MTPLYFQHDSRIYKTATCLQKALVISYQNQAEELEMLKDIKAAFNTAVFGAGLAGIYANDPFIFIGIFTCWMFIYPVLHDSCQTSTDKLEKVCWLFSQTIQAFPEIGKFHIPLGTRITTIRPLGSFTRGLRSNWTPSNQMQELTTRINNEQIDHSLSL